MSMPEYGSDDSENRASDVAGSPEGDGDFESDGLPSTGETSAGGQVSTPDDTAKKLSGLEEVIDEISTGKIIP
jgi:hypothetical protein